MERFEKSLFHTEQLAIANTDLQKCGIDSPEFFDAIAGNSVSIDSLSRKFLSAALSYRSAKKAHEHGRSSKTKGQLPIEEQHTRTPVRDDNHLPPAVTGFIISLMIKASARERIAPPESPATGNGRP